MALGLVLVLVISHLAVAALAMAIGRIQGAEEVQRGCAAGPDGEATRIQCRTCWADVAKCQCPMASREGSA